MAKKNKNKYPGMSGDKPRGSPAESKVDGFNPDYSGVIKDLKRIGVLAGCFFIVLVTLSFVLR